MSLTTRTFGSGRRVAAASLIAVAALALSACQNGTDSASHSSSASAPATSTSTDGAHSAPSSGNDTRPSGSQSRSSEATAPSAGAGKKSPSGKPEANAPSATASHTSTTAASDRCTADNMSLRLGRTDIGAGNIHIPLVFTNKSRTSCSLSGFPGVSLILRDGSTVGKPATRSGAAGGSVRLQPGQSAHAVLHTVNDGVSDTPCWKKSQLVYVYPPGSKASMTTNSAGLQVCGGRFDVTTVETGSEG
ncbi:DUF4232 domain-containing protein [Streptomyces sp. NPDC048650]|uniref:DUF4232 domain-containing protein n=1 Tax=unclassified Streptomyces TaxID=2593676 RepID=UPI00371D06A0